MVLGQLDVYMQKNEVDILTYTMQRKWNKNGS